MYDIAALYSANSTEEAIALRLAHPEADIIAGGSDEPQAVDDLVRLVESGFSE